MTLSTSAVGLLLQRLRSSFSRRILDGDDGLIGKVREQTDPALGERPNLFFMMNVPDGLVVLAYWFFF